MPADTCLLAFEKDEPATGDMEEKLRFVQPEEAPEPTFYSVTPEPGFCVKTLEEKSKEKVFINICHAEKMPEPRDITENDLADILESADPTRYRVPLSMGEAHEEVDNVGKKCRAYDILVNSSFFEKVERSTLFNGFLMTLALEGLENKYELSLSRNWLRLKNKKAHGELQPQHVRTKSKPVIMEVDQAPTPAPIMKQAEKDRSHVPEPEYVIVKEPATDEPEFLIAEIQLPLVRSAASLTLDVGEDRIVLETRSDAYYLDIYLPYLVKQAEVVSEFNKKSNLLTITMPVKGKS